MTNAKCSIITTSYTMIFILFFILPLVSSSYTTIKNKYQCDSISNDLCCGPGCNGRCGSCQNNGPLTNRMCCSITIIETGKVCSSKAHAPCIIDMKLIEQSKESSNDRKNDDDDKNDRKNDDKNNTKSDSDSDEKKKTSGSEDTINWFENLDIVYIVLISVAGACIIIMVFYACCIFGNKKPPVKYDMIIGK